MPASHITQINGFEQLIDCDNLIRSRDGYGAQIEIRKIAGSSRIAEWIHQQAYARLPLGE